MSKKLSLNFVFFVCWVGATANHAKPHASGGLLWYFHLSFPFSFHILKQKSLADLLRSIIGGIVVSKKKYLTIKDRHLAIPRFLDPACIWNLFDTDETNLRRQADFVELNPPRCFRFKRDWKISKLVLLQINWKEQNRQNSPPSSTSSHPNWLAQSGKADWCYRNW